MKELNIELENCYGIKLFKEKIDFTEKKACIIYAPNGAMKTSFAQTFKDFSEGQDSKDRIYTRRLTKRVIVDDAGLELLPEQVFVIEPYAESYESSKMSTLLVNKTLKDEYDQILQSINNKKDLLVKNLKQLSGIKNGMEEVVSEVFTKEKGKFLIGLGRIEKEILEEVKSPFVSIVYNQIFNEKVEEFLKTKDFKNQLAEYTKVYDKLLSTSTFFKKGIFNHYQANEIAKNLKTHGFFKADHSVYLKNKIEIKNEDELVKVINEEKEFIFADSDLEKRFNEIDKKLTNQELRSFREYLLANQMILPELVNLELFKEKLLKAYLVESQDLFKDLMYEYNKGKARMQQIVETATEQATEWQEVINIFNRRFSVPFIVSIENKEDVILKSVTPNLKFEFREEDGELISIARNDLFRVLSNGEKRALYILNIIFEVEARKASKIKTLFIIDDIADSFDYKNKYAIIEYLCDILTVQNFYQIMLTHNYDFYRTVSDRLELKEARFHVVKKKEAVNLTKDPFFKSPFVKWKTYVNNVDKKEMLVALIPFMRNLAEYCEHDAEEKQLTSLLHIKPDTSTITVRNLQELFKSLLNIENALSSFDQDQTIENIIFGVADQISQEPESGIELEKKVALAIAVRLSTEMFLIKKINDSAFVGNIKRNQTIALIAEFKQRFTNDENEKRNIKLVERVNLMTPENIHLNSFMYEPILDMSIEHLKTLYKEIKQAK